MTRIDKILIFDLWDLLRASISDLCVLFEPLSTVFPNNRFIHIGNTYGT